MTKHTSMAQHYAEAYHSLFSTHKPDVQARITKAVNNDDYTDADVERFVKSVIVNAERAADSLVKPQKQLANN